MIYCNHLNFPELPKSLTNKIIQWAHHQLDQNIPFLVGYRNFNTHDKQNISYVASEKEYTAKYGESGGVYFYILPQDMIAELKKIVSHIPELNNFDFKLQVIPGGNHVGPHIDDRNCRNNGPLYILETGGVNVVTTWWEPKTEFKNQYIPDKLGIPYENLIKVEEHVLQANNWYWLDYSSIHSVENLESVRLALAM